MSDPRTNKSIANYKVGCCNCEQKPTVDIVTEKGVLVHRTELCGPCCYGEAAMVDTSEWDESDLINKGDKQ